MRIIAGEFRGRKFNPPANKWPTRPTTDFAKEGLYNILQNRIDFEEVTMLDLFGGTGNHCYEFVSRGCTDVTYVEKFKPCLAFVKEIATQLDINDKLTMVQSDVFKYLESTTKNFDIIFADPPYDMKNMLDLPNIILNKELLNRGGLLIIEHSKQTTFSSNPMHIEERTYGGCVFSFFSKQD